MDMIDTHPHVASDDVERYPRDPIGGVFSGWAKTRPVTAEQFLQHMDAAGVGQAVLLQASTVYGYDNSYVADSIQRYPDRFLAVGCIDATAPDAPEKLRYWIEDRGLSGIRLFTAGDTLDDTDWLDKPVLQPFWEQATALEVPVTVKIRRTGLPMLRTVLGKHRDLQMLLDSMGQPRLEDGPPYQQAADLFALADFPNLVVKFTMSTFPRAAEGCSTVQDFFGKVVETFGAQRVMWGTAFPSMWGKGDAGPYRELVEASKRNLAFLPEADQRWIFADTARRVYSRLDRG